MAFSWTQPMDDPQQPAARNNYATQTGFTSPTAPSQIDTPMANQNNPSNYHFGGTPQTANSAWGSPSNPFSVSGEFRYGAAPLARSGMATTGRSSSPGLGEPGGPEAPLAGPGYREDWYKQYGQDLMNDKSSSEDLYSKGAAGSNPFYDNAQAETIKAINDASAARGNFNSSYTMRNIGRAVADLRGQQAHELGQLAAQSDASKFGRYDRGERYAGSAQDAMEGRARQGMDYEMGIDRGQAGLVGGFYGAAGEAQMKANLARIEAALKASGLTAAEAKQMMDQLGAGVDIVSKFYGGGIGGGGGGNSGGSAGGGAGQTWYV